MTALEDLAAALLAFALLCGAGWWALGHGSAMRDGIYLAEGRE